MATQTFHDYTGDGSDLTFDYSFPTFAVTDVVVELDGTIVDNYTIPSYATSGTKTVTFDNTTGTLNSTYCESSGAPKTGVAVRVYRDTGVDTAKATYAAGSSVKAGDLNNNQTQVLRALQEEQNQTITTTKIKDGAITSAKILDGTIASADIANDAINSQHYAAGSIDLEHMSANSVSSDQYVDNSILEAHIGTGQVNSDQIASGAVDLAHLSANSVDSSKIVDGSIVNADINASAAIAQSKIALDAELTELATMSSGTASALADLTQTEVQILDGVTSTTAELNYVDGVTSNVQTQLDAKQASDAELTELATMHTDTASALADLTQAEVQILDGATVTTNELNILDGVTADKDDINIVTNMTKQTTITDQDTSYPTSGAVVDYVAAQIAPIGGLEVIADDESFPNTLPAAGVVISITDAAGLSINSSGVSTNGDTLDNTTVTINGFPSALRGGVGGNADPYVLGAGSGLMVQSTGSSQTYNYHKALIKESDYVQLSDDINDFNSRYRIAGSAPGSDNDEGDLYFDTGANKMYVYDGSSWGEVTSTGDFKYLVLSAFNTGTGNAPTIDGNVSKYDLRENSTSGSLASVTNAAQLMVSVNGVVQQPNTGSSIGSNDGFCLVDGHTIEFGANLPSSSNVFIIQSGSALAINAPGDSTVTEAKLNLSGGSNGEFLKKDSTAAGGFVWGAVPAGVGGATGVTFNDGVHVKLGTHEDGSLYSSGAGVTLQANAPTAGSAGHLNLTASQDNSVIVTTSTSGGSQTSATFSPGNQYLYTIANIEGTATASGEIRIKETDSGSANYVGLKVPDNGVTSNYTVTLPAAAPASNGLALTATTAGVASWTSVSSTTVNGCVYENDQTITGTHTIAANKGAHSVGPITNSGTVTVSGNWVIS